MKKEDILKALERFDNDATIVIRDNDNYIIPNRVMERDDVNSGWAPYVLNENGKVNIEKVIVIDNDQI